LFCFVYCFVLLIIQPKLFIYQNVVTCMVVLRVLQKELLLRCKNKSILLLTHENADLDALCSAAIFQEFLKKNKINSVIGVPHHLNDLAQHFCILEKVSFQLNPNLRGFDLVVLFDVNSLEQLGGLRKSFIELSKCACFDLMVFDHHVLERSSLVRGKNAFIDDCCVSTTQVLYNLLKKSFSKRMHFFNCLGIVEDTGHFLTGDVKSFASFGDSLAKSGFSYGAVLSLSKHSIPNDERIAFLKAAQRSQILQLNSALVVTSIVSFYQSAAASKLLSFGADIALVVGQEKNGFTTLSGRVDLEFKELHKFNLVNHLLLPLQSKIGGDCGGHSGAAQWKGKADPKKVLQLAVDILKKNI